MKHAPCWPRTLAALVILALLALTGCKKEEPADEDTYAVEMTTELTTDFLGTDLRPEEFPSEPSALNPEVPEQAGASPTATQGFDRRIPLSGGSGGSDRPAEPKR